MLTVATWNLHQEQRAWHYLDRRRDDHGVQLAMVQEAVPPVEPERWLCVTPDPLDRGLWRISVPPGVGRREYTSAIVLLDERLSLTPQPATPLAEAGYDSFAASHPGQFAVASVQHPDAAQEVVLISLYGLWHTPSGNGAEATVHRALSDLTVLFLAAQLIVLAGDLNLFRIPTTPDSVASTPCSPASRPTTSISPGPSSRLAPPPSWTAPAARVTNATTSRRSARSDPAPCPTKRLRLRTRSDHNAVLCGAHRSRHS